MDLKLPKKINFKALTVSALFLVLAFSGTAFIFSLATPPVYSATASAWNIQRMTTPADDLNFFYDLAGAPALILNKNGDARARKIFDINDPNYYLDPASTTVLNTLGVGIANPNSKLVVKSIDNNSATNIFQTLALNETIGIALGYDVIRMGGSAVNSNLSITAKGTGNLLLQTAANGNIGIGTTAPAFKLHLLQASDTASSGIALVDATAANSGRIWMNGNDFILQRGANTDQFVLDNGGNVGIGTTSPGQKLQVGIANSTNQDGVIRSASSLAAGGSREWDFGAGYTTFGNWGFNIKDVGAGATRMSIDLAGNVGIGTTSPGTKLDIVQPSGTNASGIRLTNATLDFRMYAETASLGAGDIGTFSDHAMRLFTNSSEKIRILSTGEVGIGTTAPGYRLHVGGTPGTLTGAVRIDSILALNGYAPNGCAPAGETWGLCVGGKSGGQSIWTNTSDARLKKNIITIPNALQKVLSLRGVYFDFKDLDGVYKTLPKGRQVGFIAQEVEPILPEIVSTGGDGFKMLGTSSITALLTEAIKEQQQQLEAEKARNDKQQLEIDQLKQEIEQLKNK